MTDRVTKIVISHGDKGGVGKSFTSQAIVDYLHNKDEEVAIIDADTTNPDVAQMFENNITCVRLDLSKEDGWMESIDFIVANLGKTIIVNMPGGISKDIKTSIPMFADFISRQKNKIEMEIWWTINHGRHSINLLNNAIGLYGKYFVRVRVVCNLWFTDNRVEGFLRWNTSPLKTKIEKAGALTLYMPKLNLRVEDKLFDRDKPVSFSEAMDKDLGDVTLTASELFQLQSWYDELSKQFIVAFNYLEIKK